jgi:hypothetical protein
MKMVNQDEEHLRLLSILYYIWGGLTACFSCFGFVYALMGGAFLVAAAQERNGPPAVVGALFWVMGAAVVVIVLVLGGLTIWTGRNLQKRQHYTACMVVAAISCLSIPLGTALGVFTFVVLSRPSVKHLFQKVPAA